MINQKYNQLNPEQRYKLEALLSSGINKSQCAIQLGVHKSTIGREIERNVSKRGPGAKVYAASKAQNKTDSRHILKNKATVFDNTHKKQIMQLMTKRRFSPELISAQWKKDGVPGVSHETIYKFIWKAKHSNKRVDQPYKKAYKLLKHGKRKRKRGNYKDSRGLIPNRVSIEKRPKIVEKRKRSGDFEVDLIMGKNHKSALLVTTERSTLHSTITKLKGKDSATITKALIKKLKQYKSIKTITFDNDQAFIKHEAIAQALGAKSYFTRPYTSQDKGTIENRNGVIRLFFPKKTDFNLVSFKEIKRVEKEINNRPVRKFAYLTPNEVYLCSA
jgi:IS30 family transposase